MMVAATPHSMKPLGQGDDLQRSEDERDTVRDGEGRDHLHHFPETADDDEREQKTDVIVTEKDVSNPEPQEPADGRRDRFLRGRRSGITGIEEIVGFALGKSDLLRLRLATPLEDSEDGVLRTKLREKREGQRHIVRRRGDAVTKRKDDETGRRVPVGRVDRIGGIRGPDGLEPFAEVGALAVDFQEHMRAQEFLDGRRTGPQFRARQPPVLVRVEIGDFQQREDVIRQPQLDGVIRHHAAHVAGVGIVRQRRCGKQRQQDPDSPERAAHFFGSNLIHIGLAQTSSPSACSPRT